MTPPSGTPGLTRGYGPRCLPCAPRYPGGLGRTTKPAEFKSLFKDVESRVFDRFGDDTVVYPGHGDDTTIGAERPHLDEWRARGW
jgi:glyoxylase-like metal-dependent hydrolase (beta-lactamase superfamily II)